jgi:hypothetical protein
MLMLLVKVRARNDARREVTTGKRAERGREDDQATGMIDN